MGIQPYESTNARSITNRDDAVERARLTNKIHLLIQALGGLLPGLQSDHQEHLTNVLEIACGPGGWSQELAKTSPHMQIIGVDTSQEMISYARTLAQRQHLATVEYLKIPNFVDSYPFEDASFDLINAQFMSKFLTVAGWPPFLRTCRRLLRSGGLLRLTEFEIGLANAPGHEELSRLFIHAMRLDGRSFSPSDRHLGILSELEPLLYETGFQECFSVAHMLNYSYGAPFYEEWKSDFLLLSQEVQPLIVQKGLATQEEIDLLHQQQSYEMNLPTFHAILPMLTLWGKKR